jgi:hypothetical protein
MKEASLEARKATRFATSSEVPRRPWAGCVSGALEKDEDERLLSEASFQEVSVEVTQTYDEEFAAASGCCGGSGCCADTATTAAAEVPLASAFIRGRKPAGSTA